MPDRSLDDPAASFLGSLLTHYQWKQLQIWVNASKLQMTTNKNAYKTTRCNLRKELSRGIFAKRAYAWGHVTAKMIKRDVM
jgi:hypothetical protein